jgi:transcriptional regulator with XRE-family HTH domain
MKLAELASVLREQRELIGIPKAEIARRVQVSEGYVLMVEQGKRRPSRAVLERWASVLGRDAGFTRKLLALAGHIPQEQANGSLIDVPLTADKLHFPQPKLMEQERIIQDVQGILNRAAASDAEWHKTLEDLGTYLQFLQFRLGEMPEQVMRTSVTRVSSQMEAVKGVLKAVGHGNIQAALELLCDTPHYELFQHWRYSAAAAKTWEEAITEVETQPGNLYLIMNGLPSITVPTSQYDNQAAPLLKGPTKWKSEIIKNNLVERDKRWLAFEKLMANEKDIVFHIMPKSAMDLYIKTGYHSPDTWLCLLQGNTADPKDISAHFMRIIYLMDKFEGRYKIGLLDEDEADDAALYLNVHWEVKAGHAVLMENFLGETEQDVQITDTKIVAAFVDYYLQELWHSHFVEINQDTVMEELKIAAEKARTSPPVPRRTQPV